ncbi:MAG: ribonuclease P protein component [Crocinitomicaceae bacterium]
MTSKLNRFSFSKHEKLTSKKTIEDIYASGLKIKSYPFILNYIEVKEDKGVNFPVQIVTAVPKRKVKLAVKRNRLKRQIREAYRLNKSDLIELVNNQNKKLALFLVYIGKEKESYDFIEKKIVLLLSELKQNISKIN